MEFNHYVLSFLIGLVIILFIVFVQQKRKRITLRNGIIAILVYVLLFIPLYLIRIRIHGALQEMLYMTSLFVLSTLILFYSASKNKTATPKQLVKASLTGFGIGILIILLIIVFVVISVLLTT